MFLSEAKLRNQEEEEEARHRRMETALELEKEKVEKYVYICKCYLCVHVCNVTCVNVYMYVNVISVYMSEVGNVLMCKCKNMGMKVGREGTQKCRSRA